MKKEEGKQVTQEELEAKRRAARATLIQAALNHAPTNPDAIFERHWWPELAPLTRDERRKVIAILKQARNGVIVVPLAPLVTSK